MKTVNARGVVFGEGGVLTFLTKRMTSIRLLIAVGNFVPR